MVDGMDGDTVMFAQTCLSWVGTGQQHSPHAREIVSHKASKRTFRTASECGQNPLQGQGRSLGSEPPAVGSASSAQLEFQSPPADARVSDQSLRILPVGLPGATRGHRARPWTPRFHTSGPHDVRSDLEAAEGGPKREAVPSEGWQRPRSPCCSTAPAHRPTRCSRGAEDSAFVRGLSAPPRQSLAFPRFSTPSRPRLPVQFPTGVKTPKSFLDSERRPRAVPRVEGLSGRGVRVPARDRGAGAPPTAAARGARLPGGRSACPAQSGARAEDAGTRRRRRRSSGRPLVPAPPPCAR
ncbi:PREDICTED: coiled-coil domain-containing protein 86-like, partial [Chinchilla lanigera]|uniref:coiled-coil domain-containing protein 86-like n=1 Tax=Chinchilla lanigera TaxID=34839 RepID=UPI0006973E1C